MRYRANTSMKAGWLDAGPGDSVDLDEHQAGLLRAAFGKDCITEISPTAEEPQDEAPAAVPESSASNSEPAGAPPADEDDDEDDDESALDAGDTPVNRMVSHSGRGGGGKRGGGKNK